MLHAPDLDLVGPFENGAHDRAQKRIGQKLHDIGRDKNVERRHSEEYLGNGKSHGEQKRRQQRRSHNEKRVHDVQPRDQTGKVVLVSVFLHHRVKGNDEHAAADRNHEKIQHRAPVGGRFHELQSAHQRAAVRHAVARCKKEIDTENRHADGGKRDIGRLHDALQQLAAPGRPHPDADGEERQHQRRDAFVAAKIVLGENGELRQVGRPHEPEPRNRQHGTVKVVVFPQAVHDGMGFLPEPAVDLKIGRGARRGRDEAAAEITRRCDDHDSHGQQRRRQIRAFMPRARQNTAHDRPAEDGEKRSGLDKGITL